MENVISTIFTVLFWFFILRAIYRAVKGKPKTESGQNQPPVGLRPATPSQPALSSQRQHFEALPKGERDPSLELTLEDMISGRYKEKLAAIAAEQERQRNAPVRQEVPAQPVVASLAVSKPQADPPKAQPVRPASPAKPARVPSAAPMAVQSIGAQVRSNPTPLRALTSPRGSETEGHTLLAPSQRIGRIETAAHNPYENRRARNARIHQMLDSREEIRAAILLREVLGPPVGLGGSQSV